MSGQKALDRLEKLFRRPLTEEQETAVLVALIWKQLDKLGQRNTKVLLNKAVDHLSEPPNQ